MKRFFQAVPVFCILLLLGLGSFMPRLASLVFDRQLEQRVMQLADTNISLALEQEADFFQSLALFSDEHSQVELSGGYRMKLVDAEAAAVDARTQFAESDAAYGSPEVTPMLITSRSTPGLSGIFWRCIWLEDFTDTSKTIISTPVVLLLDDQSGRMVSFLGPVERSALPAPNSFFPQSAVDVEEYCRQYYPVDTVKLALTNEDDRDGHFMITLLKSQNGQDETYSIPIRIVDGWLYFNT